MSVFLTPDGMPFYGGTYFPPVRRYNMPAFLELLQAVAHTWETDRSSLLDNGKQILDHIRPAVGARYIVPQPNTAPQPNTVPQPNTAPLQSTLDRAALSLAQSYDWTHGGWGSAPRFPQPMTIEFLLRRATRGDKQARDMAVHVLQAMSKGGMYDLVGGGFARYSTDDLWRTPHFEKMLYDNAQLASVYLHAWLVCREDPVGARYIVPQPNTVPQPASQPVPPQSFLRVCEQTLDFVLREMTHPLGGFYSSLDADSVDIDGLASERDLASESDLASERDLASESDLAEGRFYLWTPQEIRQALGDGPDADFIIAACALTDHGNFDGKNILQRALSDEQLAEQFSLDAAAVPGRLEILFARLLESRSRRPRPATDDKILMSWNALMLAAFAEAGRYLHRADYLAAAQRNARFLLDNLLVDGRLTRSWRQPTTDSTPSSGEGGAFLEDYAALILGLLTLYQSDGDVEWYTAALHLADEMTAHFTDPDGGFFDTRDDADALLFRPKDVQDNATPSGNALAACALLTLAAFSDRLESRSAAESMLASMQDMIEYHPTAFAQWLCAADFALGPVHEVAIVGEPGDPPARTALVTALWRQYRPRQVAAVSAYPPEPGSPALLHNRPLLDGLPTAYVCQGFVCQQPTHSPEEMEAQL
jgi:hypothetical protein